MLRPSARPPSYCPLQVLKERLAEVTEELEELKAERAAGGGGGAKMAALRPRAALGENKENC